MYHTRSMHVSLPFFFFNDTATTEIYTLSLHDALPISGCDTSTGVGCVNPPPGANFYPIYSTTGRSACAWRRDRKSTRLNSSHTVISYAVFCLKKKKVRKNHTHIDHHHKSCQFPDTHPI